jgi:hypothetical protein
VKRSDDWCFGFVVAVTGFGVTSYHQAAVADLFEDVVNSQVCER